MVAPDDALFHLDGDRWMPSEFARGPWSPDALHGGPVAALIAGGVEACPSDEPMHVTRLTVELLRPVPLAPLAMAATVSRPGRKVQLVDVRISAADRELAWGRALRIRRLAHDGDDAMALAEFTPEGPAPGLDPEAPSGPEEGARSPEEIGQYMAFHSAGAELRYLAGDFGRPGSSIVWVRLAVPVIPGQDPTPLQRVAAASDFGNGVSSILDFERYLFINPDLSIHLQRPALGEWICLDARTALGTPGVGIAQSVLWDIHGPIGRSLQSLLVERRAAPEGAGL
jgi:hypothetical protein